MVLSKISQKENKLLLIDSPVHIVSLKIKIFFLVLLMIRDLESSNRETFPSKINLHFFKKIRKKL